MKKITSLALAIAVLVGVMALPAFANHQTDIGVFQATATVGNVRTNTEVPCGTDGNGPVGGPGLTLLGNSPESFWMIEAANSATSAVRQAQGTVRLCGELHPTVTSPTQLGASCATTKGMDGQGVADFPGGNDVSLRNISWEATALGTFVVTGDAVQNGAPHQRLTAVVQALDEAVIVNCLLPEGAKKFTVAAVYTIS